MRHQQQKSLWTAPMCKGAGFPLGPKRRLTPSGTHSVAAVLCCCALVPQDWCRLSPFAERWKERGKRQPFQKGSKLVGWKLQELMLMSQEFSTEDGITSTLCCLPCRLKHILAVMQACCMTPWRYHCSQRHHCGAWNRLYPRLSSLSRQKRCQK